MQITRWVRWSLLALVITLSASAFAGVFVSVAIAPPALPVYTQPPCPGDGYIWTPGYWAWGPDGYYWVPGTWVVAPSPGLLWTPGYWGWAGGAYVWHAGYWGPHIGFYGGINYGFGYVGVGYLGGYWHGGHFFYNRTVNNVVITNVHFYNRTVINNVNVTHVSFNGGRGGIMARPRPEELRADNDRHFEPTRMQMDHETGARGNRALLASVNHGRPSVAATARPGDFHHDVVPAGEGRNQRPMDNRAMNRAVPRPQNTARNVPRPDNFNRGRNDRNAPPPQNRPVTRPSAYHPQNAHPQESAPRADKDDHGRK
jgi:WXXGXW repeat (2 copies)